MERQAAEKQQKSSSDEEEGESEREPVGEDGGDARAVNEIE